jgi:hypothetical protein
MKIVYNIQTGIKNDGYVPECKQVEPEHDSEVAHFKDKSGRTVIRITSELVDEEAAEKQEPPAKKPPMDWWTW